MTTEVAWGMIWTRPGLTRKTRSMINLTMLAALNRGAEFRLHLRAALTNGVTRDEIKEILLQIGAYCMPARLEAFLIATEVFKTRQRERQRLTADKPSVGFVGVGNMGWPMASCWCGRLHRARERRHAARSRTISYSRSAATRRTLCVSSRGVGRGDHHAADQRIVERVLANGEDNVTAGMKPGTVVIEMTPACPSVTQTLAERVMDLGRYMIDAPVSGGVPRAKTGELAIMVGGDPAIIDMRCRAVGRRARRCCARARSVPARR